MAEDKPKVVDIKTRKASEAVSNDPDIKPVQFLKAWERFCKDTKVKSVMIITLDENDHITHGYIMDSDYHHALATLELEDLRNEIKAEFFEYE